MTRPSASVTLTIPKAVWWTSNSRLHWADRAKRTKAIRTQAGLLGRTCGAFNQVTITATICYPTARRADAHNTAGTVLKAAIDGLVDAGVIADDDATHLTALVIQQGPPTRQPGTYTVTLNIQENP